MMPRLVLLLSGHFRTFSWTAPLLAEVMERSSEGCWFAAAALPTDIDGMVQHFPPWVHSEYKGVEPVRSGYAQLWERLGSLPGRTESLPGRMAYYTQRVADTAFGGKLAFAILRRGGDLDRWPGALAVGWHASWAVALLAADAHGWQLPPDTVVVRARPDVLLRTPFAIDGLRRYFRHGRHGRHLMLSTDSKEGAHWYAQSDYFAVTSLGAWMADVALPLALAGPLNRSDLYVRGLVNGWGGYAASLRHVGGASTTAAASGGAASSLMQLPPADTMVPGSACECLPRVPLGGGGGAGVGAGAGAGAGAGKSAAAGDGFPTAPNRLASSPLRGCPEGFVASCWMMHAEPALVVPIGVHRDRPGAAGKLLRTPPDGESFLRRYGLSDEWPPPMYVPPPEGWPERGVTWNGTKPGLRVELTDGVHCRCPTLASHAAGGAAAGGVAGGAASKAWHGSGLRAASVAPAASELEPITPTLLQMQHGDAEPLFYRCRRSTSLVPEQPLACP